MRDLQGCLSFFFILTKFLEAETLADMFVGHNESVVKKLL
jgi:hypothetical protein